MRIAYSGAKAWTLPTPFTRRSSSSTRVLAKLLTSIGSVLPLFDVIATISRKPELASVTEMP